MVLLDDRIGDRVGVGDVPAAQYGERLTLDRKAVAVAVRRHVERRRAAKTDDPILVERDRRSERPRERFELHGRRVDRELDAFLVERADVLELRIEESARWRRRD